MIHFLRAMVDNIKSINWKDHVVHRASLNEALDEKINWNYVCSMHFAFTFVRIAKQFEDMYLVKWSKNYSYTIASVNASPIGLWQIKI